jgi:hypothetical protein
MRLQVPGFSRFRQDLVLVFLMDAVAGGSPGLIYDPPWPVVDGYVVDDAGSFFQMYILDVTKRDEVYKRWP